MLTPVTVVPTGRDVPRMKAFVDVKLVLLAVCKLLHYMFSVSESYYLLFLHDNKY